MKNIILLLVFSLVISSAFAQTFMTRSGKVTFYSGSPLEDITAINNEVAGVLDAKSGGLQFIVLIKSFKFEKALMQEHFNENYMESDKFPKADFKGSINNIASINFTKDGSYPAQASGKLTIHGIAKDVKISGTIVVKAGNPTLNSVFTVKCGDYGIKIPSLVSSKISETIKVTVNTSLSLVSH